MALDYTTIFTDVGQLVAKFNDTGAIGLLANDYLQEVEDTFNASEQEDAIASASQAFGGFRSSAVGLRSQLVQMATLRLQDPATVVNELHLPSNDIRRVIAAFIDAMNADSEDVDANVVSVGSVTANGANTGNGTILITTTLDGVSSPAPNVGVAAHAAYNGLATQLCVPSETMTFTCTADSYTTGVDEGQESFQWYGDLPNSGPNDVQPEGSGTGPTFATAQSGGIVSNWDLESWTGSGSNTPVGFDIDNGTAGTHIFRESGAANVYNGTYSLKFLGTGAQATIKISQTIPGLIPGKRYGFAIRYKASATDTSSQAMTVQFEGTGYTAGSGERVQVLGDVWPTSWTLGYFFVTIPENVPADWELVIKITGTPASGKAIYFDDIGFTPVVWHGGIGAIAVAGATPFVIGDSFTATVANDEAGTFQEFFRKAFRCQLPSDAGGSETVSDALAE